jgi:hypothetical protein
LAAMCGFVCSFKNSSSHMNSTLLWFLQFLTFYKNNPLNC